MSKIKNNYEAMFVIDCDLDAKEENATANLVAKFKSFIEENAENVELEEWGMRKLAYPINYKDSGYYCVCKFTSETEFPAELERNFNINESIIRYLVIKLEK